MKRQRLLDGANWKESLDKRAEKRGLVEKPSAGSYLDDQRLFRVSQIAERAGVPAYRASEVIRRLRREGQLPERAASHQGPVGLTLTEARIVLAALYELQGKTGYRHYAPRRKDA